MKNFLKKNVYIIGGSTGIGFSTAKKLAQLGANIAIFARNKENCEKAVKEIKKIREEQKILFSLLDASNYNDTKKCIDEMVDKLGLPDLLINSVGRALPQYFENVTLKQFEDTMKINLHTIWNAIQSTLPHMKKNGGHIVNISSIAGFLGVFGYSDYSASKFAIIGLSEVLKSEFKKYNISISVLCPPDTDTPGYQIENKSKPKETKQISSNTKLMQADEVAEILIKGIRKKKFIIIPGFEGKMTYFLKRFFPFIIDFIISKSIKLS